MINILKIPRNNIFLTYPKIILFLLEHEFQNKTVFIKNLRSKDYLDVSPNQLGESLNRLEKKRFIERVRIGRETKIKITDKGSIFIKNYFNEVFERFKEFSEFINALDKSDKFTRKLIEYINSTKQQIQRIEKLIINKNQIERELEIKLEQLQHENLSKDDIKNKEEIRNIEEKYKKKIEKLKNIIADLSSDPNKRLLTQSPLKITGFSPKDFYDNFIYVSRGYKPEIKWVHEEHRNRRLYRDVISQLEKEKRLDNFFYENPKYWGRRSAEILERDKNICKICGKKTNRVHHEKSAIYFPELCLDPINLITACKKCEDEIHNRISRY